VTYGRTDQDKGDETGARMRRQLKAWLLRVAMLTVVVVAMSGCGDSDSGDEGPAEPQTTGAATTTVAPTSTVEPTTSGATTTS
jgi:hypothetical protein